VVRDRRERDPLGRGRAPDALRRDSTPILVGEHLLRQEDRTAAVRDLVGAPLVKICGITREQDAIVAAEEGASFLGFVFAEGSPRKVSPETAGKIVRSVRAKGYRPAMVGVFRDQPIRRVQEIANEVGLDVIQFHGSEPAAMLMVCDRPVIRALGVGEGPAVGEGVGRRGVDALRPLHTRKRRDLRMVAARRARSPAEVLSRGRALARERPFRDPPGSSRRGRRLERRRGVARRQVSCPRP
jgi:hypothetical protein